VHDHWFDVNGIVHDPAERVVRFGLSESRPKRSLPFRTDLTLTIRSVRKLLIEDTEKIRFYDLNEVIYSPQERQITITGGIPIRVVLAVDRLAIELEPAT